MSEIEASYQRLYKNVDRHEPVYALQLADSLLHYLKNTGNENCPVYLWIQYEKGEALELLRNKSEDALSLYYDLVRKGEAAENWKLLAETYISIARTHEIIGRADDCLRNLKTAREIIEKHSLYPVFARFAVRYASYHRIYGNQDSARLYAAKAIEFGKKYKVQRSELDGNLLMGILTQDLEKSVGYFQEATNLYLEREAYYGASGQKTNIASRYIRAGFYKKAMNHLDEAKAYAHRVPENYTGYYQNFQKVYDLRRQVFEVQGMIDSAYIYLKKSLEAGQLADIRVNQQKVTEQETTFAIEREQIKLNFEKQQSSYLRWGILLMFLILVFMALGHFNNERKKRFIAKQKDIITEKNKALNQSLNRQLILLSEVHHRVKNNLQLVMSLLSLKGHKTPDTAFKNHCTDLSNKIYSIALIHEHLYRAGEFETVIVQDYFHDLVSYLQSLNNEDTPFIINYNTEDLILNLETILPLGIIVTELICNSLKYARLPDKQLNINLSLSYKKHGFILLYQDNGSGYPNGMLESKTNSIGEMLISSMARQLQAETKTSNDKGAVFKLTFQEKQVSSV